MRFRPLFALVLSLVLSQASAEQMPQDTSKIFWGIKESRTNRILHSNGRLAWSGVRQGGTYDSAHAFYHAGGSIAWDGLKRTRNSWGEASKKGIFYHSNGKIAWGGIPQKLNSWGEPHDEGVFYYSNGQVVWEGVEQKVNSWGDTRSDAFFYHSNGVKAWGGLPHTKNREDSILYYENGEVAWDRNGVYDEFGGLITPFADYVYLALGNCGWLYVDREGSFILSLSLGEGYILNASQEKVNLALMDNTIDLN